MKYFPLSRPVEKSLRIIMLLAILFLSLGPGGTQVAYAAPPAHDDFDSAKVINTIEYHDTLSTVEATPSDTIPNPNQGGDPDHFSCEGNDFRYGFASVWYKYTPPETQSLSLNTIDSDYDTFIAVWTGTKGNLTLVPGACNDDTVEGLFSELSFTASAGTTYYIEVAQFNDGQNTTHNIGGNLIFNAYITNTNVTIGGVLKGRYFVPQSGSLRKSFLDLNAGPVQIKNQAGNQMIAAERVIYKVQNVATSFSEMMGLPESQLSTIYWFPWYNNVDLDTQLRFGNVSNTTAHVDVYIAGTLRTPTPITLLPGASIRQSFTGVNNGPVKVVSDVPIVAAERVIYRVRGLATSFSEMMGLPDGQLSNAYWLPWYNNVDLDTQIRIGNVSNTPATINIYIAGTLRTPTPITLAVGASTRISYPNVNNGPVRIVSNVNIVAAERVIYKVRGVQTSFSEMMGLPNNQLNNTYWFPWYNNVNLDTQLRFANVSETQTASVNVYIGGQLMAGSPFTLLPKASTRQSFVGVDNGPVRIVSNIPIVAAERVIYKVNGIQTSFSEMMGLPNALLDVAYWMPWYNNVDLDTQLRFGLP